MNKKILAAVGGVGALAFIAFLAFGVFGIHTKFTNTEVSEGGPNFDSGAQAVEPADNDEPADTEETDTEETAADGEPTSDEPADADPADAEPTITTEKTGEFAGLGSYSVSGNASVVTDGNQRFLSLADDFNSSNGPDLKVYLRAESGEFINLGELKGNIGDQNYEIDGEVDLETYATVEIWCERFNVGFGEAPLANP